MLQIRLDIIDVIIMPDAKKPEFFEKFRNTFKKWLHKWSNATAPVTLCKVSNCPTSNKRLHRDRINASGRDRLCCDVGNWGPVVRTIRADQTLYYIYNNSSLFQVNTKKIWYVTKEFWQEWNPKARVTSSQRTCTVDMVLILHCTTFAYNCRMQWAYNSNSTM